MTTENIETALRRLDMLEDVVQSPHEDIEAQAAAQSLIDGIRDDLRTAENKENSDR